MKTLLTLLLILLLTACTPYTNLNKAKSEYLCRDNGGVHIWKHYTEYPLVCKDGTKFPLGTVNNLIIPDPKYYPKAAN